MRLTSIAVLVASAVLACSPPSAIPGTTRDANVITSEEIAKSNVFNAYDAVRMLRPVFLNSHGATTIAGSDAGYAKVYLNHILYGDLQSLRTLEAHGIREIRYYNGTEASTRFGLDNVSGAIDVITDVR